MPLCPPYDPPLPPQDTPPLPQSFRLGKATATVYMAGSHLSPSVNLSMAAPASGTSGAALLSQVVRVTGSRSRSRTQTCVPDLVIEFIDQS